MTKVSILVPTRNEYPPILQKTIDDIYAKATGEIEVIVAFDGPPYQEITGHPDLVRVDLREPVGLRAVLNILGYHATGDYIFKVDAHCMFGRGFDEILKADCDSNWIVVPRMFELDYDNWQPRLDRQVDYYYLSCPWTHPKFFQMQSCFWLGRTADKSDVELDDIMAFQGSAWFMTAKYWKALHGVAETPVYGPFAEHQELSLKAWLGGGRVVVNKRTWYAHEHRTNRRRGYHRAISDFHRSHIAVARYFATNQWPARAHDFEWLIEKFWPLPTLGHLAEGELFYWPTNWRETIAQPAQFNPHWSWA